MSGSSPSILTSNMEENLTSTKSPDQEPGLGTEETVLGGILMVFAIAGIVGNSLLINTYKTKNLQVRFDCLMLMLATIDLVFLILLIFGFAISMELGNTPWLFFIIECVFSGSVYTTTVIAMERYLLLCRDM